MFGTIRRHQAWLWWIIAGITIASFVVYGPSGCNNRERFGSDGANYGSIGTHRISSEELRHAQNEVSLGYFMRTQQWPDKKSDFNVEREAYIRLFLIEKEKQYGIQIDAEALAEYARRFIGNNRLEDFVTQILKPAGLGADDFERYLRHDAGIMQLVAVTGLSGKLVTPEDAARLWREEHQELVCSMVFLGASNYMSSVTMNNDTLLQFYTNRMANYREPAKMQVNYVKFNVTNYWADTAKGLTNIELSVEENIKKMGTNLFPKTKTPQESRAALKDAIIRQEALKAAHRDAGAFAVELDAMEPKKAENLATLAKTKGLTLGTTQPFDETAGPKELDVPYNFSKTAFGLSEAEPFSGSVQAEDGYYVLGFKSLSPSSVPSFHSMEPKVTADYRFYEGSVLAQQAGMKSYTTLTNGLALGKSFPSLTATLGLKTESLPPFSLSSSSMPDNIEERVPFNTLRQVAFSTPVGSVSQLAPARNGVFLLYVEKKLPTDESKLKSDLPAFLAYMRQARQADAFNQWLTKQMLQDPSFAAVFQQVSQETQMRSGAPKRKM